jgi:hypothetical protein
MFPQFHDVYFLLHLSTIFTISVMQSHASMVVKPSKFGWNYHEMEHSNEII